MYHDLLTGISNHPSWILWTLLFFVIDNMLGTILLVLQRRITTLWKLETRFARQEIDDLENSIGRLRIQYDGKLTASKRELSGYQSGISDMISVTKGLTDALAASPTIPTPFASAPTGFNRARDAARNGDLFPE